MPAAKKSSSRAAKTARKRSTVREPAALKRLNKSLDAAQDALAALRNDVSKDVSVGARGVYKDVQKFVKEARRDSRRLGKSLQRDIEMAQKRLSTSPKAKRASRAGATRRLRGSVNNHEARRVAVAREVGPGVRAYTGPSRRPRSRRAVGVGAGGSRAGPGAGRHRHAGADHARRGPVERGRSRGQRGAAQPTLSRLGR